MIPGGYKKHFPVMLNEVLQSLTPQDGKVYVDATFGNGGYTEAILKAADCKVIALDRDPNVIPRAEELKSLDGSRFEFRPGQFGNFESLVVEPVDGAVFDIGVSSMQLDEAGRGFSFSKDAPLDMRMSQDGPTAADLVNTLSEKELTDIFYRYGEEKFSRSIARAIVHQRESRPLSTTLELAELVKAAVPAAARRDGHPARRVFQALRIAVNRELDCLSSALDTAFDCLNPGGRLAVITFHSLEDRMVKQRFIEWKTGCVCPPDFPDCVCGRTPAGRLVLRKPAEASPRELEENPRSRSAKLRCIEKLHERYR